LNFTPLRDTLLVQQLDTSSVTESGIILNSNKVKLYTFGKVLAIGEEITNISVDSIIMYNPISGIQVKLDSTYTLLQHEDVYGIIGNIKNNCINTVQDFKILHPHDIIVKVTTIKKDVIHTSGIILTTSASVVEHRPTRGEVVSVGSEVTDVIIGDIVEFGNVVGIDLITNEDTDSGIHYVMMEDDRPIGKYI
jgi:co-chaperonin GroES (HSP10)